MGQTTGIQWCDGTVNPTGGCDGCELWGHVRKSCYAGGIHTRWSPSKSYPGPFEQISLHPGRMAQAARWSDLRGHKRPKKPWLDGLPRIIFISDMSDALSAAVPFSYLEDEIIQNVTSEHGSRHIWMWLTKLPHRMAEFGATFQRWPVNLWAGTSCTTQATTKRAAQLFDVRAAIHFVSLEPMWEPIDLNRREYLCRDYPRGITIGKYLDLVICGGESGPSAKPFDLSWARKVVQDCRDTTTPCFVKQLGGRPYDSDPTELYSEIHLDLKDSHGGDWSDPNFPEDLKIREFPITNGVSHAS